jgi:hypothetical protein
MEATDTFSHNTLHLVINQLAIIISYADLIMDAPTDERARKDLLTIRECARTAARLLERPLAVEERE